MSANIIDKKGNVIYTAPKIGYAYFSDGLCNVMTEDSDGGYKHGFINETGELVIPYLFEAVEFFNGGVARVKKNGKWGLINKKGVLICPCCHKEKESVPLVHNGIVRKWDRTATRENDILSYIDTDGKIVIDTSEYPYIGDFCNGYASVRNSNDECALINTKGEIVIPFGRYSFISEVHFGVARVGKYIVDKTYEGYVNTSGVEVVPVGKYDHFYWHFSDDMCVVCAIKGDKCGYIDKTTGQEIVPCNNKYISTSTEAALSRGMYDDYYEDTMVVIRLKDHIQTNENKICVFNTKLHKAYYLNDIDDIATHYSEGLCAVLKDGKVGFIDENCRLVIPYKFDCPNDGLGVLFLRFKESVCAINNMLIDKLGNVIKRFDETFYRLEYIGDGVYAMDKKHGAGIALVDLRGNIIFDGYRAELRRPLHSEFPIAVIDENLSYNNTWRFIDKDGRTAFPYTFNEGYSFVNGFAIIDEAIIKGKAKTKKKSSQTSNNNSGCYIATAVYGSYDCPEVWTLRRYRDDVLDNTKCGRLFIRGYYAISPTLVKWFGKTNWFKKTLISPLNRFVNKLNKNGIANTPYKDKY